MSNWREHAKRAEWDRIGIYELSEAERAELLKILKHMVPRRIRGTGIETFEAFIDPNEAQSQAEFDAAVFARNLAHLHVEEGLQRYYGHPFAEPLALAIETLEELGIRFEGFSSTYLYWHPGREAWAQLESNIANAIQAKKYEMLWQATEGNAAQEELAMQNLIIWENLYPWRRCGTIESIYGADRFNPASELWHSANIIAWFGVFNDTLEANRLSHRISHESRLSTLIDAGMCGLEIGRSYDALMKKPFEPHAISGMKTFEGARLGGEMRRRTLAPETQRVLDAMEPLVRKLGKSAAARIVAARGIGKSAGANRTLWHRHKKM